MSSGSNSERKDELPKMQVGFIDVICVPLYRMLSDTFPWIRPLYDGTMDNRKHWQDLAEKVEMGLTWIDHDTIDKPVEEFAGECRCFYCLLNGVLMQFLRSNSSPSRRHQGHRVHRAIAELQRPPPWRHSGRRLRHAAHRRRTATPALQQPAQDRRHYARHALSIVALLLHEQLRSWRACAIGGRQPPSQVPAVALAVRQSFVERWRLGQGSTGCCWGRHGNGSCDCGPAHPERTECAAAERNGRVQHGGGHSITVAGGQSWRPAQGDAQETVALVRGTVTGVAATAEPGAGGAGGGGRGVQRQRAAVLLSNENDEPVVRRAASSHRTDNVRNDHFVSIWNTFDGIILECIVVYRCFGCI